MAKQPKVTQVLYSGTGGHGSVVFSLIGADTEQRWCHGLVFYGVEPLKPSYAAYCEQKKIPYTYLEAHSGRFLSGWRAFYRVLREQNPDIIVLHSISLLLPAWYYTLWHHARLLAVEHTSNRVKRRLDREFDRFVFALAKKVIVLHIQYGEELRRQTGSWFRRRKLCIIPNGIDTRLFSPGTQNRPQGSFCLGMAGRFTTARDQAILVRVMQILRTEGAFRLRLAGDGPGKAAVEKLVRALELNEVIELTGNLEESEMPGFYRGLDVYVQASFGEAMSTAIMQAMSCGLPVVASDVPGISGFLPPDCGILVRHEAQSFADAVLGLANDTGKRLKLGQNGSRYALQHFSNDSMFDLYNKLVDACMTKEKS